MNQPISVSFRLASTESLWLGSWVGYQCMFTWAIFWILFTCTHRPAPVLLVSSNSTAAAARPTCFFPNLIQTILPAFIFLVLLLTVSYIYFSAFLSAGFCLVTYQSFLFLRFSTCTPSPDTPFPTLLSPLLNKAFLLWHSPVWSLTAHPQTLTLISPCKSYHKCLRSSCVHKGGFEEPQSRRENIILPDET